MDRPKRGPDRQLAFRYDLSRQSLSLAQEILRRFPDWEVDWDAAELAQTSTVRGWKTLPLVIGGAR